MLEFQVDQVELWSDHLHGEVHHLTNLMDPDYQCEVVAGELGMVDNEVEQEEESEASAAEEEEDPKQVVPANDDGDHDDMDADNDA